MTDNKLTKGEKLATTTFAFIVHLIAFSAISYGAYEKWGFSWWYVATAIILPVVFLLNNLFDEK